MVASVRPNPFRIRDNELDSNGEEGTLRELLSVAAPTEPRTIAIRQAQLEALVRMVPATLLGQFVAASMVAISLYGLAVSGSISPIPGASQPMRGQSPG